MSTTTTTKVSSEDRGDYETDTRWTAIDEYTLSHLHPSSRPNHATLESTSHFAFKEGLPDIAAPRAIAKFFALQCKMLNVKHSLEFGTLGGYSAIWLATENPELRITTFEYDPHHAEVSRHNFKAAGVSDRIELIVGPALDAMPKLYEEIQSGQRSRYGFTFIDADKKNNYNYVDWAVKMSLPRACICVDNVVAKGRLTNTALAETDDLVSGARNVVERVGKDERVDATVIQTVGEKEYDGFLFAMVK